MIVLIREQINIDIFHKKELNQCILNLKIHKYYLIHKLIIKKLNKFY